MILRHISTIHVTLDVDVDDYEAAARAELVAADQPVGALRCVIRCYPGARVVFERAQGEL